MKRIFGSFILGKNLIKNEKGNAILITALFMSVFILLSALVIDSGLMFLVKARLANATDAAVLAAVQELPGNPTAALAIAKAYSNSNGVSDSEVTFEVFNSNREIKAVASRRINLIFGRLAGFMDTNIVAKSTAAVGSIKGIDGIVPLGIEDEGFEFNHEYTLKVGAGSSETGWFGALALGGPGANTYEDNLTYGYRAIIKIGDIIDVKTGNMSNPTKRAIDYRMNQCNHVPKCTAASFVKDCKRLVKVPVIKKLYNGDIEVVGFSIFLVNAVTGQGNQSIITGSFVRSITSGDIDLDGTDYGLLGVKLTQ